MTKFIFELAHAEPCTILTEKKMKSEIVITGDEKTVIAEEVSEADSDTFRRDLFDCLIDL